MLTIIYKLKTKVRALETQNKELQDKLAMEEGKIALLEAENKELSEKLDGVLVRLMTERNP